MVVLANMQGHSCSFMIVCIHLDILFLNYDRCVVLYQVKQFAMSDLVSEYVSYLSASLFAYHNLSITERVIGHGATFLLRLKVI